MLNTDLRVPSAVDPTLTDEEPTLRQAPAWARQDEPEARFQRGIRTLLAFMGALFVLLALTGLLTGCNTAPGQQQEPTIWAGNVYIYRHGGNTCYRISGELSCVREDVRVTGEELDATGHGPMGQNEAPGRLTLDQLRNGDRDYRTRTFDIELAPAPTKAPQ